MSSVQLIRRVDQRIPKPLLSESANGPGSLGKLTDLRAHTPPSRAPSVASTASKTTGRGWTDVVSASMSNAQQPKTAQSQQLGWGAPGAVSANSNASDRAWRSNIRPSQTPAAGNGSSSQQQPSVSAPRFVNSMRAVNVPLTVPDDWERDES